MNEVSVHRARNRRLGLRVATVVCACLLSLGSAQVTFTNLARVQAANIHDPEVLEALVTELRELGALSRSGAPTIVQVQSIDSRHALPANESSLARLKGQTELIAETLARLDAPEGTFVATQWGTPEDRIADGQMMGRDTPFFPTTPEELVASGLDWLVDPHGFHTVWDDDGSLAVLTATRQSVRGREMLGNTRMILCVDDDGVLAWARSQRQSQPTDVALGRFVEACARGEYEGLSATYALAPELIEEFGLTGAWFAVLVVDAFSEPVPVERAVANAESLMAATSGPIPLLVVARETVTSDFDSLVSASDHRAALAERGIEIDTGVSDSLPEWVFDFATHPASTLVVFDETGRAVAHFAASPSSLPTDQTLQQWLLLHGLL